METIDDKPLKDRPMKIYDREEEEKKGNTFGAFMTSIPEDFDGYIFLKLFRDPQGNSGSNPTWGDYYKYSKSEILKFGRGVYKSMDYDAPLASYCEKLWSLLGKKVFHSEPNPISKNLRIPHITVVKDEKSGERGAISHIILNNDKEDLIGINTILFHKYDRQALDKMRSVVVFDDLLYCLHEQIPDEENYKEVEKQIIQVLLLDAVTNNVDRHTKNWSLVRDKETNHYTLGVFDHGSSFVDLISQNEFARQNNYWSITYTKIDHVTQTMGIGDSGEKIVRYLVDRYPEIAQEFNDALSKALPEFQQYLVDAPSNIDVKRIMYNLTFKQKFIDKMLEKQRGEGYYYDD